MTKIAVLGANGKVGAELCLILRNHPEIELIPICRNRSGSAFLRYFGIPCRHGLPADPEQAVKLFGDCDVIVNSALGFGHPKEIREAEDSLITNSVTFSPPHAKIVYFSTQLVYGNPRSDAWIRWQSAYGRTKRRSERLLSTKCAKFAKDAYILRLGLVLGELQNITANIREKIRTRKVFLPPDNRPSNTLYTCTIADAVLNIAEGREKPGTYDLMSFPKWNWREVYYYEAEQCKMQLEPKNIQVLTKKKRRGLLGMSGLGTLLQTVKFNPIAREFALRMMSYAPRRFYERFHAKWTQTGVKAEIQALGQTEQGEPPYEILTHEMHSWVAIGKVYLSSLTPTCELLGQRNFRVAKRDPNLAWPADLPLANSI